MQGRHGERSAKSLNYDLTATANGPQNDAAGSGIQDLPKQISVDIYFGDPGCHYGGTAGCCILCEFLQIIMHDIFLPKARMAGRKWTTLQPHKAPEHSPRLPL